MSPTEYDEIPVPPEEVASALLSVRVPRVASCENRLVDEAVVEKRLVEVAFERVVLPVKELIPENVLSSARSVEEAAVIVMLSPLLKEVPLIVARRPVK